VGCWPDYESRLVTSFGLCLSGCRSCTTSLEEDLAIASQAGFSCIDLWSPKLDEYLAIYPIVWLDMKLREQHVYPAAVSGVELAVRATREQDLVDQARFMELCTHLDTLGGGIIVVHPRVQGQDGDAAANAPSAQTVPGMVRALRAYSDLAAPFDVHVALEFRADAHSTVRTLAASQEIVQQVSQSNVGLSLNTLDMCKSGITPEGLNALDVGRLKLVHLEAALPACHNPAEWGKVAIPAPSEWGAQEGSPLVPALHGIPEEKGPPLRVICAQLAVLGFRGPYCITCPSKAKATELAPGGQGSSLEHVREAKQAALDLLTPLYL
jgi:sugar phosphate isomerase/epimerase